ALNPAATGRYAIRLDKFLTESEFLARRLAGLGRVWGAAKFFHPFLAYKDIDWDNALVKAIPLVKAARTPAEYRTAVNAMLEALEDPMTVAELPSVQRPVAPSTHTPESTFVRMVDDHLVINAIDAAIASSNRDSAA